MGAIEQRWDAQCGSARDGDRVDRTRQSAVPPSTAKSVESGGPISARGAGHVAQIEHVEQVVEAGAVTGLHAEVGGPSGGWVEQGQTQAHERSPLR